MVLRKAWVANFGTYSVNPSADPYDPNAGQVYLTVSEPTSAQGEESLGKHVKIEKEITNNNVKSFLRVSSLANLATIRPPDATEREAAAWTAQGAPTEVAIEVFARRFGWNRVEMCQGSKPTWKHIAEFQFDSDVKKMSSVYEYISTNEYHVLTKVSDPLPHLSQNESVTSESSCCSRYHEYAKFSCSYNVGRNLLT